MDKEIMKLEEIKIEATDLNRNQKDFLMQFAGVNECPVGDQSMADLFDIDLSSEESAIESYKCIFPKLNEGDGVQEFFNVVKEGIDLWFPVIGMITFTINEDE